MDKSWFDYLGKYDTDMDIWGGENFGKLLSLRPGAGVGITVCLGHRCLGRGPEMGPKFLLWGEAKWGPRGVVAGRVAATRDLLHGTKSMLRTRATT